MLHVILRTNLEDEMGETVFMLERVSDTLKCSHVSDDPGCVTVLRSSGLDC